MYIFHLSRHQPSVSDHGNKHTAPIANQWPGFIFLCTLLDSQWKRGQSYYTSTLQPLPVQHCNLVILILASNSIPSNIKIHKCIRCNCLLASPVLFRIRNVPRGFPGNMSCLSASRRSMANHQLRAHNGRHHQFLTLVAQVIQSVVSIHFHSSCKVTFDPDASNSVSDDHQGLKSKGHRSRSKVRVTKDANAVSLIVTFLINKKTLKMHRSSQRYDKSKSHLQVTQLIQ